MRLLITLATCFLTFSFTLAQKGSATAYIKEQSQVMAKAIAGEEATDCFKVFADSAFLLPEYHPTLKGASLINSYYAQFFKKTQTIKYEKESFEIMPLEKGYYIELGTFSHTYITSEGVSFDYEGKYMTYWITTANEAPQIIAHIWGSSRYFEAPMVDMIYIYQEPNKALESSTRWEEKIEKRRREVYKSVLNGDADQQMTSYHKDAVYMTYYDPPFIGKDKITDYFKSHYNPEVTRDSLMTQTVHVIDLGNYALKFGEYYVSWTYEGKPSFIYGKGLSLYKEMPDSSIKIYRQMINHSMPAISKSDADYYKVTRLLRHLDSQQLSVQDYLSAYDQNVVVMPPDQSAIQGKSNFASHLTAERKHGSLKIEHNLDHFESYNDVVIATGSSSGRYTPTNQTQSFPFKTKNLMILKRNENGELKISQLIWNKTN